MEQQKTPKPRLFLNQSIALLQSSIKANSQTQANSLFLLLNRILHYHCNPIYLHSIHLISPKQARILTTLSLRSLPNPTLAESSIQLLATLIQLAPPSLPRVVTIIENLLNIIHTPNPSIIPTLNQCLSLLSQQLSFLNETGELKVSVFPELQKALCGMFGKEVAVGLQESVYELTDTLFSLHPQSDHFELLKVLGGYSGLDLGSVVCRITCLDKGLVIKYLDERLENVVEQINDGAVQNEFLNTLEYITKQLSRLIHFDDDIDLQSFNNLMQFLNGFIQHQTEYKTKIICTLIPLIILQEQKIPSETLTNLYTLLQNTPTLQTLQAILHILSHSSHTFDKTPFKELLVNEFFNAVADDERVIGWSVFPDFVRVFGGGGGCINLYEDESPLLLSTASTSLSHLPCIESSSIQNNTCRVCTYLQPPFKSTPCSKSLINKAYCLPIHPEYRVEFIQSLGRLIRHEVRVDGLRMKEWWGDDMKVWFVGGEGRVRRVIGELLISLFTHPLLETSEGKEIMNENVDMLFKFGKDSFNPHTFSGDDLVFLRVFGEIGKRLDEDQAPQTLLFFLRILLGDSGVVVKAFAFEQLNAISNHHHQSLPSLFLPHIEDLSKFLIKSLTEENIPKISNLTQTLLHVPLSNFLQSTIEYILPYLITTQANQSVGLVCKVLGESVRKICIQQSHFVLAKVFLQPDSGKKEGDLNFFLGLVNEETEGCKGDVLKVEDLIEACWCSLLTELAGELGSEKGRKNAHRAFQEIQVLYNRKYNKSQPIKKTSNATTEYVDHESLVSRTSFLLRMLVYVNDSIANKKHQTMHRKIKAIKSLIEIIRLIGARVHLMLAQVMATLQTALDAPSLRDIALEAWETFIHTIQVSKLGPILNQITAVLLKSLPSFTFPQKIQVSKIMEYIIITNEETLKKFFPALPEFPDEEFFIDVNHIIKSSYTKIKPYDRIELLLSYGVRHENALVAHQALVQLRSILENFQGGFHSFVLSETVDDIVVKTIQNLLETCRRFNGIRTDIQILCCECLGMIGAVDPGRMSLSVLSPSHVSQNLKFDKFQTTLEKLEFITWFMEKHLEPALTSTQNTVMQGHLSYSIQELLRFCGFTNEALTSDSTETELLRKRWIKFPKSVKDTLRPLLDAKYSYITNVSELLTKNTKLDYPIYPKHVECSAWMQEWALDLISKCKTESSMKVFAVFVNLLKDSSITLSILPNLVLDFLIGCDVDGEDDFVCEVLSVLKNKENTNVLDKTEDGLKVSVEDGNTLVEKRQLSTQTIFSVIDHLNQWVTSKKHFISNSSSSLNTFDQSNTINECQAAIVKVEKLLSRIPQLVLANSATRCKAYARALIHYESYFRQEKSKSSNLQPLYSQLQRIYSHLDEPDALEGISSKVLVPTLDQQILEHESTGLWTAALTCNELALQQHPRELKYHVGVLNCLKNLNHLETMVNHIDGVIPRFPEWSEKLVSYGVEASWRLGRWETLDNYLSTPHEQTFETSVGHILSSARKELCLLDSSEVALDDIQSKFSKSLLKARETLIAPLSAASMESYDRSYDYILKLQMLCEVEQAFDILSKPTENKNENMAKTKKLLDNWNLRLQITTPTFKSREPILNIRRILLHDLRTGVPKLNAAGSIAEEMSVECGKIWLETSKLCLKSNYFQSSFGAILHASELNSPDIHLAKSKWEWKQGFHYKAIKEIQTFLSRAVSPNQSDNEKFIVAKSKLRLGSWMEDTNAGLASTITEIYSSTLADQPQWEKCSYYIGRMYSRSYEKEKAERGKVAGYIPFIVKYYGKALQFGNRYLYQTLPRLLTVWLDFDSLKDIKEEEFTRVNGLVDRLNSILPANQFYTALAQIISRMAHPNPVVYAIMEKIIIKVLRAFPQQSIWQLVAGNKSTNKVRATRVQNLLNKAAGGRSNLIQLFQQAIALTDQLILVCNHERDLDKRKHKFLFSSIRPLSALLRMTDLQVIVPLQSSIAATLPVINEDLQYYSPFPDKIPTIAGFQDEFQVMSSLIRPKKITLIDNQGKHHHFLCKPKDDLRKDCRLMEFNAMINRLFKKDIENVRTYAVFPLNEQCGIIEWIENTVGVRNILLKMYAINGKSVSVSEIKKLAALPDKYDVFKNKILPRHPPIMHKWFLEQFPEPTEWFRNRLAYSVTTACMSMVGYIVGLGDRHGENILIDQVNGDCVHVDLNCLFERGLSFDIPEVVPFRLTHNMVDGLGVNGVEGVFRKSCEVVLQILRRNSEGLMCVLETFIHDPLIEWAKRDKRSSLNTNAQRSENEQALQILKTIKRKLQGAPFQGRGSRSAAVTLSVEAQVEELIVRATDQQKLCLMYIGWAPFL